ncbi:TonB-dependent siderophore receptor [Sphingomonas endophytica]|nr:TonB-dependent siderophore receptor [Sphingomonas endophytica]
MLPNAAGAIRRTFFPGEPAFDRYDRRQYMLGYALDHRLGGVWTLRQTARFAHIDTRFEGVAVNFVFPFAGDHQLNRAASRSDEAVDSLAFDQQVEARFTTGPVSHTLLFGVAYQGSWAETQASGFGYVPPIDYLNPVYGRSFARPSLAQHYRQSWGRIGVYAQDLVRLGRLAVTLGGREDRSRLITQDRPTAATARQDDHDFTGRVGAAWLFDNGLAPYASYSTSFEPVLGTGFDGRAFQPSRAQQSEAGIRYQPSGIDGIATISGFDIAQRHVSTADPLHPFFTVQSGEIRSRGIEAEARAALTPRLEVIAAYTYLDTTIRRDTDSSRIGKRSVAVPEQLASLWSTYRLSGGTSVSAGVRHIGQSAGDPAGTIRVSPTTLLDGALRYDFGQVRPELNGLQAALNVSNLFDRRYIASCFNAGGCFYGNGRIVTTSLALRW